MIENMCEHGKMMCLNCLSNVLLFMSAHVCFTSFSWVLQLPPHFMFEYENEMTCDAPVSS